MAGPVTGAGFYNLIVTMRRFTQQDGHTKIWYGATDQPLNWGGPPQSSMVAMANPNVADFPSEIKHEGFRISLNRMRPFGISVFGNNGQMGLDENGFNNPLAWVIDSITDWKFEPVQRNDINDMSAASQQKFVNAVLQMKQSGKYDEFVTIHNQNMVNAHRGPAFLPWHREFLWRFEQELLKIDSTITLPYWDWSNPVNQTSTAIVWGILGGNGNPQNNNKVETGPFSGWTITVKDAAQPSFLTRNFGSGGISLPSQGNVEYALQQQAYDNAPWSDSPTLSGFRNVLEGWWNSSATSGVFLHNLVHVWVGGNMVPASSPNDPIFFLHHAFIDKIWVEWIRRKDPNPSDVLNNPTAYYQPSSGAALGHNLNDDMIPFPGVKPLDVLDHTSMHKKGYIYSKPTFPTVQPITPQSNSTTNWKTLGLDNGPFTNNNLA